MPRFLNARRVTDIFVGCLIFLAMLSLVLFPKESVQATKEGLSICFNLIIPSLFPFFVLSSLIVEFGLVRYLGRALEGIMRPLFNVGGACSTALVLGLIGGYPVGARTAISLYEKGMCSKEEAERLLSFSNNTGPAFILGVVGAGIFSDIYIGILLYLVHIAAAVCVGLIFRFYKSGKSQNRSVRGSFRAVKFSSSFTSSVKSAFLSILNICAFIIFFTVVIKMLFIADVIPGMSRVIGNIIPFGLSPEWIEKLLTGIVEVSSGVISLQGASSLTGSIALASFMLGWAGLSIHCQVLSFMGENKLSLKTYFVGKFLHGVISAALVFFVLKLIPIEAPSAAMVSGNAVVGMLVSFTDSLRISLAASAITLVFILSISVSFMRKKSRNLKKNKV